MCPGLYTQNNEQQPVLLIETPKHGSKLAFSLLYHLYKLEKKNGSHWKGKENQVQNHNFIKKTVSFPNPKYRMMTSQRDLPFNVMLAIRNQ